MLGQFPVCQFRSRNLVAPSLYFNFFGDCFTKVSVPLRQLAADGPLLLIWAFELGGKEIAADEKSLFKCAKFANLRKMDLVNGLRGKAFHCFMVETSGH
jgi:hypothetical protein